MLKIKKYIAFTLAELMVIMAVMTVILAAVAPVFTARYSNISFDNVWSLVGASDNEDIYTDAPIKSMMQEVFIGNTPTDITDIKTNYNQESKLIIRSSHKISGNKPFQKQIEFHYDGNTTGYLFAGNRNILLGGRYDNIKLTHPEPNYVNPTTDTDDIAHSNTSLGNNALNSITDGDYNTAFGYHALAALTSGSNNTAIGVEAGKDLTIGNNNVLIGYNISVGVDGHDNTIIGNPSSSESSNYITAIGDNTKIKGNHNVAIGYGSNAYGDYNTAVGYNALGNTENPHYYKYNTAIGYNSCSGIEADSMHLTCIGGAGYDSSMTNTAKDFFKDDKSRVLIGKGVYLGSNSNKTAATLEVHNLSSKTSSKPFAFSSDPKKLGDSSVIVNGNLIVRGQTYLTGRSIFPNPNTENPDANPNKISLMGYRLYKEAKGDFKPLIGFDGSEYTMRVGDTAPFREVYLGKEHCICSYSSDNTIDNSYDWTTKKSYYSLLNTIFSGSNNYYEPYYFYPAVNNNTKFVELNMAKNLESQASCCPILRRKGERKVEGVTSDLRLKNIISPFKNSLDLLSRLKIYNYTFKSDKNKMPHVGAIAQDLRAISPNSVSKDNNGYYKIRWDEMFYSAINSVKELNSKLLALADRIQTDISRIITLKKENNMLRKKLFELSNELDDLESK